MSFTAIQDAQFPAPSKTVSGTVQDVETNVTLVNFSDRILLTVSQEGTLSQWVQVPLMGTASGEVGMSLPSTSQGLLPSIHLTPRTLLGGGGEDRETMGQLYAAQIASRISMISPDDRRTLVLGLGMRRVSTEREGFFDLLDLVHKVL